MRLGRAFIGKVRRMKWQDAVFATGEVVFMIGLFPSLLSDYKPAPLTSFSTAFMLYLFLLCHASFKLWLTFTLAAITATIWLALGLQVVLS
jgi:hypothetical protein